MYQFTPVRESDVEVSYHVPEKLFTYTYTTLGVCGWDAQPELQLWYFYRTKWQPGDDCKCFDTSVAS